jgi:3-phosphoshikimate 1-carboxyvinyltransferase
MVLRFSAPRLKRAEITMPGDKSISHRIFLLAAQARGTTNVMGANRGADVLRTVTALRELGVPIAERDGRYAITGIETLSSPAATLDCGNSGSTMRMLLGMIAGSVRARLDGDASLRRRPMERAAEPLRRMGARIETNAGGFPPIEVYESASQLRGITYELPVPSAQVKTAVLLAGLRATDTTTVVSALPSRDHTERMLLAMNAPIKLGGPAVSVRAGEWDSIDEYFVVGDLSAAAFFFVVAAAVPDASVVVRNVGFNPNRTAIIDALRAMGAIVRVTNVGSKHNERFADVEVRGHSRLRSIDLAAAAIPNLIDELPALCALAAVADGASSVRGAEELRHKESDRIAAIAGLLRSFGVEAHELPDGLIVEGARELRAPKSVSTGGDHRIGMAAAALAAIARAPIAIDGGDCIATSFPDFKETWSRAFIG